MTTGKRKFLSAAAKLSGAIMVGCAAAAYIAKRASEQVSDQPLGIDWKYLADGECISDGGMRLYGEFMRALQRAVRGYDDSMFYSFHGYLDKLIIEDLRYMIHSRSGSPILPEESEVGEAQENTDVRLLIDCDESDASKQDEVHERFTEVLKQMLYHFEQSQDEYCSEINEFFVADDFDFYDRDDDSEYDEESDEKLYLYPLDSVFKDRSEEAFARRRQFYDREHEIDKYKAEHHEKALDMLRQYYNYLWD